MLLFGLRTTGEVREVVTHGSYLTFENVEELEEYAELVVIGYTPWDFYELKPEIVYSDVGTYIDYSTPTEVVITDVIKGSHSEKTVFASQRAAYDRKINTLIRNEDCTIMEKGKLYVLFLGKAYGYEHLDTYSIIAVNQGKFNIDGTDDIEKSHELVNEQYRMLKESVLKKYGNRYTGNSPFIGS
jgi:hypothetical protein